MPKILICDDQQDIVKALQLIFKAEGWEHEAAHGPKAALERCGKTEFDAAIIDMNYTRDTTSGQEGLELLSALLAAQAELPVVVMTAWGSIGLAVEAMRRGARDFVEKPWDNNRLVTVLRNQIALGQSQRRERMLAEENRLLRGAGHGELVAESAAMKRVVEVIAKAAPADVNVLITGENGVGKGMVARALHAASRRAARPLITVNLGGLAPGVFESELFGHVKGAFTGANEERIGRFELADGGTLFLDEIGNIAPTMQASLLRVLETGEMERVGSSRTRKVDVRLISATNAPLQEAMEAGGFRKDLFYRLNTVEIMVPPLRERREDVLPLARNFLARHARHYGQYAAEFAPGAREALLKHHWPGNVRELDHVIERAMLFARGTEIVASDLALAPIAVSGARLDDLSLEDVERVLIQKALAKHDGNVSHAATTLGLSRSALYRRLAKHGL